MTVEGAGNPMLIAAAALPEFLLSHRDLFVSRYFPTDQNIPVNLRRFYTKIRRQLVRKGVIACGGR